MLTLLHELAHIEVTAHDGAFFQLLGELARVVLDVEVILHCVILHKIYRVASE